MTIASEISRLQTAKSNIKSSIEGKWVTVPNDAKLDSYPTYINQIMGWWVFSGVKLYNNEVTWYDARPNCWWVISFEEWWNLYWCCWAIQEKWSSNDAYCCFYTFRKIWTWDIDYTYNRWDYYNWYYWSNNVDSWSAYTNWTNIKFYIFSRYYPAAWNTYINAWEFVWSYKTTGGASYTRLSAWTTYNPTDYAWVDLTWYTEISWSSRVSSAVWNEINDDWYIYLVLK